MRGRFHLIPLLDAEAVAEHDGELGHGGGPFALGEAATGSACAAGGRADEGFFQSWLTRRKTKYSSLIAASSVGKCPRLRTAVRSVLLRLSIALVV